MTSRRPVIVGLTVLAWIATTGADSRDPKVLFEEHFKGRLSDGWSWVREDRDAWELGDGVLRVRAAPGNLWEAENNARNLLLRPAPQKAQSP